jgi:class 3 adenylate cyclase/TolB-like protein/tetratricopeptide (TPR) repeat protein
VDVSDALPERERAEAFRRQHQSALVTLVFTDLVDSVALRRNLGDQAGTTLFQTYRRLVRDILQRNPEAEEIETAGDSFLFVFTRPSDAVKFALLMQSRVRVLAQERKVCLANRIGIHVGEVVIQAHTQGHKPKDLYGSQVDLCARVMSVAQGDQILLTRAVFDSARQALKGEDLGELKELRWLDHGPYRLKGIEELVDICEVGEVGVAVLRPPASSDKVQPQIRVGHPPSMGLSPSQDEPTMAPWRGRIPGEWQWPMMAGLFILIIGAGMLFWKRFGLSDNWQARSPARDSTLASASQRALIRSLAVKPIDDFAGDTNNMYLSDGMTEALCAALGNIGTLRVPGRSSVMRYKSGQKSIPEMARELNVDAILEGSIERTGNRMLITLQLIEAASGRHLWSTNYQGDLSEFFKVPSEVARAIAGEMQVRLTPDDQIRLAPGRSLHPQALEAYLEGRQQWNRRTPGALRKAVDSFARSVEIEGDFALGYAGLADAYCIAADHLGLPFNEAAAKAKAAARKAIELDDRLAEPHVALGYVLANKDWNWREAESEFLRAIALKPNYPPAHYWYAFQLLVKQGRTNEALTEAETALKLEPLMPTTRQHYAMALIAAGRTAEAIDQLRIIEKLDSEFPLVHLCYFTAYLRRGDYDSAIAAGERLRAQDNLPYVWGKLGYAYAVAGQREPALKLLDELKHNPISSPVDCACIQAGLGMREEALANLELGFTQHAREIAWLRFSPQFDSLRAEPRFQELLRKVGLEP